MRKLTIVLSILTVMGLVLAACQPQAPATATEAPVQETEPAPATEEPTAEPT